MDKLTELHVKEWTDNRNINMNLFDKTNDQVYRYRYEACDRLLSMVK
jgi:hypothetical protein